MVVGQNISKLTLCFLVLGGFGIASAVFGMVYLIGAVTIADPKMTELRSCYCQNSLAQLTNCKYFVVGGFYYRLDTSGSSTRSLSNSTKPGPGTLSSLTRVGSVAVSESKNGRALGLNSRIDAKTIQSRTCNNVNREITAGYLAVIMGLLQLGLIIPYVVTHGSEVKTWLITILVIATIGTLTACSCVIHVYVDVKDFHRQLVGLSGANGMDVDLYNHAGFLVDGDRLTAGDTEYVVEATYWIALGNTVVYTFGYFNLVHLLCQIGCIAAIAVSSRYSPTMAQPYLQ